MHQGLTKYPFRVSVYTRTVGGVPNVKHFNAETVGQARGIQMQWVNARFTEKVEITLTIDTWIYSPSEGERDNRQFKEPQRGKGARVDNPGNIRSSRS